jgi:hypothetical protein
MEEKLKKNGGDRREEKRRGDAEVWKKKEKKSRMVESGFCAAVYTKKRVVGCRRKSK